MYRLFCGFMSILCVDRPNLLRIRNNGIIVFKLFIFASFEAPSMK